MPQNPYAPPVASVSDIEASPVSRERPRMVRLGVQLLWAQAILSLPKLYSWIVSLAGAISAGNMDLRSLVTVVYLLAFAAVEVLLAYLAWKGRHWARVVKLALMILAVLTMTAAF